MLFKVKDSLRTLFGIRQERQLVPAEDRPTVGSSIVRERLRIRLRQPISDEQWLWFAKMGWRTIDLRKERRTYLRVPDKILHKLLQADGLERDVLLAKLVKAGQYEQGQSESFRALTARVPAAEPPLATAAASRRSPHR